MNNRFPHLTSQHELDREERRKRLIVWAEDIVSGLALVLIFYAGFVFLGGLQ